MLEECILVYRGKVGGLSLTCQTLLLLQLDLIRPPPGGEFSLIARGILQYVGIYIGTEVGQGASQQEACIHNGASSA